MTEKDWHPRTQLVHSGSWRSELGELSEALFLTQGFVYPSAEDAEDRFRDKVPGFIYARYGNPTTAMFEQRIATIEGAEAAFATASGMAAIHAALFSQLGAGDHVVAPRDLFGSCLYILETLLPRFGVETTLVEGADLDAWRAAVRPNTKVALIETPSNPTLNIVDIRGVSEIVHSVGARLIVDNVFATPLFQKPLALGADIVMYSATKHIDGQGRCLGGVLLGTAEYIQNQAKTFLKHTGGSLSPFNAWIMLKGLETMDLRCRAQAETATRLADDLAGHPALHRLIYPGRKDHRQHALAMSQMSSGGTMISFDLKGGKAAAFRMLNNLQLIKISNNLGDAKSIITHPATTTHERLTPAARSAIGIGDGLLRLSVGLEDARDLRRDLEQALDRVAEA